MIGFIIKKIIGSKNDREVRRLHPLVARINELEASLQPLTAEVLGEKTGAWKERLSKIEDKEAHVVTVNDYLAARDSEWMGAVYRFLGLTVGCILHDQPPAVRREQYNCDITYGTNAEFGFDYLRDNGMAATKEEQVQRGHYYAIV